ncbi:MAG: DUF1016 family protein, partial [Bacteroidetes bacterium]|nr:DUF1016 family protein [Bacteroidota bacterium]
TFGNKHYRIDLVFYHRILKCHVLLDLKIGEFDHSDAGQMNMYLNYYKENESHNGDNPPVGIILCSGKNEALLRISLVTLTDWIKRGLPSHKQRGRVYFDKEEVLEYIREKKIGKLSLTPKFHQLKKAMG